MLLVSTFASRSRVVLRRACRLLDPQIALVALVALVVEAGLRLSTLPRLTRLLGIQLVQDGEAEQQDPMQPADLPVAWIRRRAVAMNRVFAHWPFDSTCLRRALVLGHRIRRLSPILMIGVRNDDSGALTAHAWLVVSGIALDPQAAHYEALRDLGRG